MADQAWTTESWYRAAFESSRASAQAIRANAQLGLSLLASHLPGESRQQIVARLVASNRERLDAVPDLTTFPELRGVRELVAARWRGTRDGAELDEAQWAAYCDQNFYYRRHVQGGRVDVARADPGRCTYIYFPSSDVGPLLANNLDSSPGEAFGGPGWPVLGQGLIWGTVSSGVFLDEASPQIFPAPVRDMVGRFCHDTASVVAFLTRYTDFWGPSNSIVVDRDHDVAMIEKSARRIAVRRSRDGFGFITSMTAEDASFRAYLDDRRAASLTARGLSAPCADTAYWAEADRRRQLLHDLLDEARAQPTLERLRNMIQHRSQRGRVCYAGDQLPHGGCTEHTLRTTIWQLDRGHAQWWAKQDERPSWDNPQSPVNFPQVPTWSGSRRGARKPELQVDPCH